MSKFDGVLGRSTQPLETVSKVLSARAPGKSADPDYQKTTVYLRKQLHRNVKIACLKANPPLDMSDSPLIRVQENRGRFITTCYRHMTT